MPLPFLSNYSKTSPLHRVAVTLSLTTLLTAVFFTSHITPHLVLAQSSGITEVEQQKQSCELAKTQGIFTKDCGGLTDLHITGASIYNTIWGAPELPEGYQQGALPQLGKAIAQLYTPPAASEVYIADLFRNAGFGFVSPAYAQGLGFSALNPVLETWKMFRNIAYFFYVLVFLGIGFMIMLRQKVGTQAAVGVQQALPSIVISLVAVNFSYPIAGLMIDLMYLIMYFLIEIAKVMGVGGSTLGNAMSVNTNIFYIGYDIIGKASPLESGAAVQQLISAATDKSGTYISETLGFIGGITFAVVFSLAILFAIFRLFFDLLKIYIGLVLDIVASPILLMLGAIPGKSNFGKWIKGLFFNLAAFPTVLGCIIIAYSLIDQAKLNDGGGGFAPPYLLGSGGGALPALIGMGILLIIPEIVAKVKKMGGEGIFSEFAGAFNKSLQKGWTGDQLIPGVGATNTAMYGLSGKNLLAKPFFGTKESNAAVSGGKLNFVGRGFMGEAQDTWEKYQKKKAIDKLQELPPEPSSGVKGTVSKVRTPPRIRGLSSS